ncbi:MAG: hypothetical protein ACO1RX_12650 [Candidatus Sericytochromatia bacterium]
MKDRSRLLLHPFMIALSLNLLAACQPTPTEPQPAPPAASSTPAGAPSPVAPSSSPPAPLPAVTLPPAQSTSSPAQPTASATPGSASGLPQGLAGIALLSSRTRFSSVGQQVQLTVHLLDAAGNTISGSAPLEWSSSDPQDFSVDAQGLVTALRLKGASEISVRIQGTDYRAALNLGFASSSGGGGGGGNSGSGGGTEDPTETLTAALGFNGLGRGEFQVNTETSNTQANGNLAMLADGNFVVTWASTGQDGDGSGIYAQRFDASGLPLGEEFQVNHTTTGQQVLPDVAADGDGNFVISWNGLLGSDSSLFFQRFDAQGQRIGSETAVNPVSTQLLSAPHIAMDEQGNFVIAWDAAQLLNSLETDVYAQRFDADGVALSAVFPANAYTTSSQASPSVAMNADGDFVIAWTSLDQDGSAEGVYARHFSSAGTTTGADISVNTYTSLSQNTPDVAMDATGHFVVTWTSHMQLNGGASHHVFGRRFAADGSASSGEFLVNTTTTYSAKASPTVAMDAEGDFVVAWESQVQDPASDAGIYAQRYSSTGLALGAEFQVNTYVTGNQSSPTLAMGSGGEFCTVWDSVSQDGDATGIFVRCFGANGLAQ